MALLTRDQILATPGRRFEEVEVPEWGGSVRVWSMTAAQLLEYHEKNEELSRVDALAWVLCACLGDEAGPTMRAEDVAALSEKHAAVLLRLLRIALRVNGLTKEAAEELRGN